MSDKLERLVTIGFVSAGQWLLVEDSLFLKLEKYANVHNVLYAFVVGDELVYIGKTIRTLSVRMAGYRSPGPSQSTNINNNHNICSALKSGHTVSIYVLPNNGLLQYGGFHINLAAGLEDSLIRELAPAWNGGRKETRDGLLEQPEETGS